MTGIIHFPTSSRRMRHVSRRALLAGAAGYAAAATFSSPASAQGAATPAASPASGEVATGAARERLGHRLSFAPSAHLGGPDPNAWLFSWLDLQSHLQALGDPDPFAETTNIAAIMAPAAIDDPLLMYAMDPVVYEYFGFSPLDVHQTLVTGVPPEPVTYYAGGVETSELPAIWEAAGYEPKSGDAGDYWTIGENAEVDLESPLQRIALARMNNLAILDDGTIVAAPTVALLGEVQALAASGGESAADDPDIAALVDSIPETAIQVIAVPGGGLEAASITPENPGVEGVPTDLLEESDDAVGPMPVIGMAFFGITTGVVGAEIGNGEQGMPQPQGDPENARYFVHLLLDSETDATAAAAIVLWRFENMTSPVAGYVYAERFVPEFTPDDAVQGEIAALSFSNPETLAPWYQMLAMQDLWPFAWAGE